jgi:hypothetical protein
VGVYYDAWLAWGLYVPHTDELDGVDLTDVYDIPAGFNYLQGGNHLDGTDYGYVILPQGASTVVMDTMSYNMPFGVKSVKDLYRHTDAELAALLNFARHYGLDEQIGWFAVSAVG